MFGSSTSLQLNSVFLSHRSSTNLQPPASQQCFSLTPLQHQPPAPAQRTESSNKSDNWRFRFDRNQSHANNLLNRFQKCQKTCTTSVHTPQQPINLQHFEESYLVMWNNLQSDFRKDNDRFIVKFRKLTLILSKQSAFSTHTTFSVHKWRSSRLPSSASWKSKPWEKSEHINLILSSKFDIKQQIWLQTENSCSD